MKMYKARNSRETLSRFFLHLYQIHNSDGIYRDMTRNGELVE